MGFWDGAKGAAKAAAVSASVAHNIATGHVSDAEAYKTVSRNTQSERTANADALAAANNRSTSANDRRK